MYKITFQSAFYFGDVVKYQSSLNGSNQGRIVDIALSDDGSVYYVIECDDGETNGGIYQHDIVQLISKHTQPELS